MREEFATLLRSFRERAGRSRNNLAQQVGVDPSYLTRIEHGDREPPRLHIIEALARCLKLSLGERNQLLVAAGYAPVEVLANGWSDTLQAVAEVLTDPWLTPEDREMFGVTIKAIAQRWRANGAAERQLNGHAAPTSGRGGA